MLNLMQKYNQHGQNSLKKGLRVRVNTNELDFNYPYTKSLLESFAAGGDGFITKAYDLSGRNNHATQTTESAQPKIITTGILNAGGAGFDGGDFLSLPVSGFNSVNHEFNFKFLIKAAAQVDKSLYTIRSTTVGAPNFSILTDNSSPGQKLRLYIRNDTNSVILDAKSTTVVFDGNENLVEISGINGTVSVKINGVADATNFNYTPSNLFVLYTANRVSLGCNNQSTPSSHITGNIKSFQSSSYKYNFV